MYYSWSFGFFHHRLHLVSVRARRSLSLKVLCRSVLNIQDQLHNCCCQQHSKTWRGGGISEDIWLGFTGRPGQQSCEGEISCDSSSGEDLQLPYAAFKGCLFCITVGGLQWVGGVLKELINRDVSNMFGKDLHVRTGTSNYCTAAPPPPPVGLKLQVLWMFTPPPAFHTQVSAVLHDQENSTKSSERKI